MNILDEINGVLADVLYIVVKLALIIILTSFAILAVMNVYWGLMRIVTG